MAHNVLGMEGNGMVPGDSGSVFISSSQEPSASIQKSGCTTQIHCSYKPLLRNSVAFGKMGMPRVEKLRYRVEMGVWYYNSTELQAIGQTGLTALRRNEEHRAPDSGGWGWGPGGTNLVNHMLPFCAAGTDRLWLSLALSPHHLAFKP